MEPRSWTDSRLAAERAIWRCFGLRRAEALDWGSDDSSIALGVNAGDTLEMRYASGSIADGDGLISASCAGRRRGMGDNARKGRCTSNENQRDLQFTNSIRRVDHQAS